MWGSSLDITVLKESSSCAKADSQLEISPAECTESVKWSGFTETSHASMGLKRMRGGTELALRHNKCSRGRRQLINRAGVLRMIVPRSQLALF